MTTDQLTLLVEFGESEMLMLKTTTGDNVAKHQDRPQPATPR